mmetsp:Transcript_27887/g.65009  ORF Transcript_27887/g.65009 Transcript_27887/m.65009 type:complete len:128 (+) Transcript_27887:1-384(+)
MGGMGGMGSMFSDDFFGGGFGGGGGGFSSFSSMSTGGGGGGVMTSTSTSTRIVNGKRVTVTEKTVRKADGTVETTRSESTSDGNAAGGQRLGLDAGFGSFGDFGFGSDFFGGGGGRGRRDGSGALRY